MLNQSSKDSPLERYISILEMLAPFSQGLTAAEIEVALDLPKATVNRLLHALLDGQLITVNNARNRTYRLGDRILQLVHNSSNTQWIEPLARRPLELLTDLTGQSAFISKLAGDEVRSVTCTAPDTLVRIYIAPGTIMPLNATATAKVLLAYRPDDEARRILAGKLAQFTPNTKIEIEELIAELREIRARGYATELGEHVSGLSTIAFPIGRPAGKVTYALGLTGPHRDVIEADFERNRQAVADTAARLTKLLKLSQDAD